ncbi:YhgE/Pip domain-containing protein [Paenibacillus nasutitermitis]|uniref:Phage infection protein n=1 Tax=Paenibacillus nasutitermitis TaxID=1652958 RepID=A0A916YML4_9BACL|nr:YhgE/Pip domain-containing protein [Paenibacillus nasutitermitis]GGD51129.1 phage infection protein [Paenibacillus nasutitermitis]
MKSSFAWFVSEWKSVLRSPMLCVSLFGVMCIPVLYSGMYLWAFWDPYAHIEKIPVAVVNEDRPVEYEGKTYAIGNDLTEELKKDHSFAWAFVSRALAEQGLGSHEYYFSIMIPEDFSRRATTLTANQPTPLELHVVTNEGLNYSVSKIGQSGVEEIRQKLSNQLSENYAAALFLELAQLKDGLQKASGGAADLHDGLQELSSGTAELLVGIKGRQDALRKLDEGGASLKAAAAKLSSGSAALAKGAADAAASMEALGKGLAAAEAGSKQLGQAAGELAGGVRSVNDLLKQFAESHPDLAEEESMIKLNAAAAQTTEGLEPLLKGITDLNAGIANLGAKQGQIRSGIAGLSGKLKELSKGASQLGKASQTVSAGIHQVREGWDGLIGGLEKLSQGEARLTAGSRQLSDSLSQGADQLSKLHASQSLYEMMANPVRLKEESFNKLPNYGTGMAPFFLSISLYVGALLLSTVFPMRSPASSPPSGFMWAVTKYSFLALVSIVQVLLVSLIITRAVGLHPQNMLYFVGFGLLASLVFMALIQLLVVAGDNVGRFVAVILLVLQLTATSGTFPVELVPQPLQRIHAVLPVSYTVDGFRSIISTGDYNLLREDSLILLLFGGASLLLTIILLTLYSRGGRPLQPAA